MGIDWYVTNGEIVVGPVGTNLLLRGVAAGKVPDDCKLWRHPWPFWRSLASVREVRALRAAQARLGATWEPSATWTPPPASSALVGATRWIASGSDEQEVVGLTLQAVAHELRATSGLAHRPERRLGSLVTRSAIGEGVGDRLGEAVPPWDRAMRVARLGATVIERPDAKPAGLASLDRLGAGEGMGGVALAPIYFGPRLVAILELGKRERPFRASDRALLRSFTRVASRCLAAR
jgi:hypothetical protein